MTREKSRTYALVAGVAAAALVIGQMASTATAEPVGGYEIAWYSVDSGGGASTGGAYALDGTIGQPDAGSLSGGAYTLAGGFWAGLAEAIVNVFLPLVTR
jgi:hypothetical protein